ncbi:hypothetical protein RD792_002095 [Penstemon davidsonii]|uniref:t-SNARE coiled-coil homology domain-containing protein n=1 Tax=Penstemon davidsonii TaxID=160366 RepID=A0ABR0DQ57_9LAMI|nr:hypothetical protein RD792_002095 [Penstemon davidsonii]
MFTCNCRAAAVQPTAVQLPCSRCAAAVQPPCSRCAAAVQPPCFCRAVAVQPSCVCRAVAVQPSCVCRAVAVQLLCSHRAAAVQPLCSCRAIFRFRGTVAVGLPPAWVDVSEEVATNIQRVRGKMTELAKAHAKALMPSFGDGKEDQRRIEALTHEITDILKKSEKRLQKLSAAGPSEDSNIRKNVQGPDGDDLEMNLNGSNSKREDDDFDDMVVKSVNDLAQIMKDLSVLVIDQGTIVDRIDYNITNVAASVEDGLKQLQKAERSQKKGGMVMCATVLVIMCFVMLVLLILKEIIF